MIRCVCFVRRERQLLDTPFGTTTERTITTPGILVGWSARRTAKEKIVRCRDGVPVEFAIDLTTITLVVAI